MSDTNLVPFGKYKGQPIEVLVNDRQYLDWLTAQPWFRERHENLYTIIINNFAEPSETPEHNKLQAKFLDNNFCLKCIKLAYTNLPIEKVTGCQFEAGGVDVIINLQLKSNDCYYHDNCYVEVKPDIADDYPAVLRQMKRCISNSWKAILLVDRYNATGATREQFVEIFKRANIAVIFLADVNC